MAPRSRSMLPPLGVRTTSTPGTIRAMIRSMGSFGYLAMSSAVTSPRVEDFFWASASDGVRSNRANNETGRAYVERKDLIEARFRENILAGANNLTRRPHETPRSQSYAPGWGTGDSRS